MSTWLKILLFITIPIWVIPAAIVLLLCNWYINFSDFVDDWFRGKNK